MNLTLTNLESMPLAALHGILSEFGEVSVDISTEQRKFGAVIHYEENPNLTEATSLFVREGRFGQSEISSVPISGITAIEIS